MVPPEYRVFLIIGASVLAGALLGAMLIHKGWPRAYFAIFGGHALGSLGLYIASQQAQDMQALGYVIMLVGFALPATLGLVLGGGVMWLRGRLSRS